VRPELTPPDQAPPDLTLRARRMVTPDRDRAGVAVVRGGIITAVITDAADLAAADVDLPDSCVLLPGLVDSHVEGGHSCHPGQGGYTDQGGPLGHGARQDQEARRG
jgi:allantoinase